jgi:hypothetical protein
MFQQNRVSEMPFPDSALTPPVDKPTASPQRSWAHLMVLQRQRDVEAAGRAAVVDV